MKILFLLPYMLVRWLVIIVIFLALLLIFLIEFPSVILVLADQQLKEQGISYGEVEGGLLRGVRLTDINYQDKVKIKKLNLKVDWERLEERILYIDHIKLKDVEIDSDYLSSLIDNNNSENNSSESNITLPFDQMILNQADISFKNIIYDAYRVTQASLEISNLRTDMKKKYQGDVRLLLDSNVTKLKLDGSIKNEFVKLIAEIEPNREFINPFVSNNNITLINNPILTIKADGNMTKVKYHLNIHRLGVKQNEYEVNSKKLILFGNYNIPQKDLEVTIKTELKGSMAYLKLDGDATLSLDDLNNTLNYKLDTTINPKESFLTKILTEQNITFFDSPTIKLKSYGNMKKLNYNLIVKDINLKQNEYRLSSENLSLHGKYSVLDRDVEATIKTELNGNVAYIKLNSDATLNLDDLNNTLNYKLDTTISPKKSFLTKVLKDHNVTFFDSPTIKLKSSGSMRKLKYNLILNDINLKQNSYKLKSKNILLNGDYSPLQKDIKADIKASIDSNVALLDLDVVTELNLDDLNNTLKFKFLSKIRAKKEFIESQIDDINLSIDSISDIDITANGNLKDTKFRVDFGGLIAQKNDINFKLRSLRLKGETNPLGGDTAVDISLDFDSTVSSGWIKDRVTLNFHNIESSFKQSAKIDIDANAPYINRFLKDEKMVVQDSPKLKISVDGGIETMKITVDGYANFTKDNKPSKVTLKSKKIKLDLKHSQIDGKLKINNSSKEIGFNLNTLFSGDYSKPEKLNINSTLDIKSFNSFGVNLNPIMPLKLKIKNNSSGALVQLYSPRIKLMAKTPDHDHFSFDIESRNLYLYKMVELPKELEHKFIRLDLKGSGVVSKEYFKIKGTIDSNKKFQAKIDIKNDDTGLDGIFETEHISAKVEGNLKKRDIDAKVHISSLRDLQMELNRLYKFKRFEIDGSLKIGAKLKGEEIWAKVDSPRLALNGFDIDALELDAHYNQELLTIHKLNLETIGFEDEKLNKKIYLNQDGKIHLGKKRDLLLDIHPNILIKAEGEEKSLNAKVEIDKLPLGHPDYGSMVLNCDIDYEQRGEDKSITGLIDIRKMKLFYEAKFLNVDYDSDVIVLKKGDKNRKNDEADSFLEHTSVDIEIKAPHARYRTPDIDLIFNINLNAKKNLSEPLGIFGKIEDINGRYDQVPKRFEIQNSNIVFTGEEQINPLLDIHVEYELPQVLIYIDVSGNANRPKIEFSSEPPMPKKDIMSYLLLGVSATQIGEGEGSLGREAELFILNQAARDLAYEFDLDRVFIKDDGTGEGFAIETGKKISKKNMFIIESSKQGNSFILEHDVSKNIKLRVGQHQKEIPSQSIDIYFRKKFK